MAIEQGELFWHNFGPRNNHLQEGLRPALVVQSNALNRLDRYPNVIIVPLTTRHRPSATYVAIEPSPSNELERTSYAIGNQIFTMDKGDLGEPIGSMSSQELFLVKRALKISLGIELH